MMTGPKSKGGGRDEVRTDQLSYPVAAVPKDAIDPYSRPCP